MLRKLTTLLLIFSLYAALPSVPQSAYANEALVLPQFGAMPEGTPAANSMLIKGIEIHPENPFLFDFILDVGQNKLSESVLNQEGQKLIKYFLAALAISEKDLWVNLSPYEKGRIIPDVLAKTDMGRDLLAQDYMLKQVVSSLMNPATDLGKSFWQRIYQKAKPQTGDEANIPVNLFNKVWIKADKASVFVKDKTALVLDCHLKVMLEQDYLASVIASERSERSNLKNKIATHPSVARDDTKMSPVASQVIRSIILPELEREVNEGKSFAALRQVFHSIILASWFKNNLKQAVLNQVYANKGKVKGIDINDPALQQRIYTQYLRAYKKGAFNFIKDEVFDDGRREVRKYFAGGVDPAMALKPQQLTQVSPADKARLSSMPAVIVRSSLLPAEDKNNKAMVSFNPPFVITTTQQLIEMVKNKLQLHTSDQDALIAQINEFSRYYLGDSLVSYRRAETLAAEFDKRIHLIDNDPRSSIYALVRLMIYSLKELSRISGALHPYNRSPRAIEYDQMRQMRVGNNAFLLFEYGGITLGIPDLSAVEDEYVRKIIKDLANDDLPKAQEITNVISIAQVFFNLVRSPDAFFNGDDLTSNARYEARQGLMGMVWTIAQHMGLVSNPAIDLFKQYNQAMISWKKNQSKIWHLKQKEEILGLAIAALNGAQEIDADAPLIHLAKISDLTLRDDPEDKKDDYQYVVEGFRAKIREIVSAYQLTTIKSEITHDEFINLRFAKGAAPGATNRELAVLRFALEIHRVNVQHDLRQLIEKSTIAFANPAKEKEQVPDQKKTIKDILNRGIAYSDLKKVLKDLYYRLIWVDLTLRKPILRSNNRLVVAQYPRHKGEQEARVLEVLGELFPEWRLTKNNSRGVRVGQAILPVTEWTINRESLEAVVTFSIDNLFNRNALWPTIRRWSIDPVLAWFDSVAFSFEIDSLRDHYAWGPSDGMNLRMSDLKSRNRITIERAMLRLLKMNLVDVLDALVVQWVKIENSKNSADKRYARNIKQMITVIHLLYPQHQEGQLGPRRTGLSDAEAVEIVLRRSLYDVAEEKKDEAMINGGIDLNTAGMNWDITGEKTGVSYDAAMLESLKKNDFEGLTPQILSIKTFSIHSLFSHPQAS